MTRHILQMWIVLFGIAAGSQARWARAHQSFEDFPLRLIIAAVVVTGLLWGINRLGKHFFRGLTDTPITLLSRNIPINALMPLALLPLPILFPLDLVRIFVFFIGSLSALILLHFSTSERLSLHFQKSMALFFSIAAAASGVTQFSMMVEIAVQTLCLAVLFIIPGFMALRFIFHRYCSIDGAFLISFPATLFLLGPIWILGQHLEAPAVLYALADTLLIAGVAYGYGPMHLVSDLKKISIGYRFGILLVVLAALISMAFLMSGSKTPWLNVENGLAAAYRGMHKLPTDNSLQYDTAVTFNLYKEPWRWMPRTEQIWTMGDRPPLMAVVNSILAFFTLNNKSWSFHTYQVIGTFLNTLFLLPLVPLLMRLFRNRQVAFLAAVAVFINIFIFLNTYYTWPKLLGVFFVLASLEFAFTHPSKLLTASVGGLLWGFGALSHEGVLLSLPLPLFTWLIWLWRGFGQSAPSHTYPGAFSHVKHLLAILGYLATFLVLFTLLQAPWIWFKKSHPDIDSNNLVYHYLPTEDPDHIGHTRQNHLKELKLFLESTSLDEQISHRKNNLKLFQVSDFRIAIQGWLCGDFESDLKNIYVRKFFYPVSAIGEFQLLLALLAITLAVLGTLVKVRTRLIASKPKWGLLALFIFCSSLSYLFNVLAKWTPSFNHELPYAELVIFSAIVYGIALLLPRPFNLIITFVALVQFFHYIAISTFDKGLMLASFFNTIALLFLGMLYKYAIRWSNEHNPSDTHPKADSFSTKISNNHLTSDRKEVRKCV